MALPLKVYQNGQDGVLTVSKTKRQELGSISKGSSRVFPSLVYHAKYQFVQTKEELKVGDICFLKSDNTVSKTKDKNDNTICFAIANCKADYYCFVGLEGAFLTNVDEASDKSIVYFDIENTSLTSEPQETALQGSLFISDKDENNQAIVLIR